MSPRRRLVLVVVAVLPLVGWLVGIAYSHCLGSAIKVAGWLAVVVVFSFVKAENRAVKWILIFGFAILAITSSQALLDCMPF